MKKIDYCMRFEGSGVPNNDGGTELSATATGKSCVLTAVVGASGLTSNHEGVDGRDATFTSQISILGDGIFTESGTITFGGDNRIHFSTVGTGFMGPSPDEKVNHGAIIWKVDRGEGQFEGATGWITSNFSISDTGRVVDNQFGTIFLK